MERVILSTKLIIGEGTFAAQALTKEEALAWLGKAPVTNYCGHETVKILGLEPAQTREQCQGYDEALAINAKSRLEFGREYSVAEMEAIGVEYTLIRRVVSLNDVLAMAAKLPSGLNDDRAAHKLLAERDELLASIASEDDTGALTEIADGGYYAVKHLDWLLRRLADLYQQRNFTLDDIFKLTMAKYKLRARPGNPKDDAAERAAVVRVLK